MIATNRRPLLPLLLIVVGAFSGCLPQEPYESCGFPPAQEDQCIISATDSPELVQIKKANNCVIQQPQCSEGYCMSVQGQSGFCSEPCTKDDECPEDGSCKEFALECVTVDKKDPATGEMVKVTNCLKLCVKKGAL
ncbi:MAG: hypothetical protein FJ109_02040 [Deltaproteobacteria bacterium]|nr:hypothetical protein [Deltaproteobacteria bacterium]